MALPPLLLRDHKVPEWTGDCSYARDNDRRLSQNKGHCPASMRPRWYRWRRLDLLCDSDSGARTIERSVSLVA